MEAPLTHPAESPILEISTILELITRLSKGIPIVRRAFAVAVTVPLMEFPLLTG